MILNVITPLNITQAELSGVIEHQYGIKIAALTFLPQGEVSWIYKIKSLDDTYCLYCLKVHKATTLGSRRFQLLFDLHTKAKIKNIIYPKPTLDGKLEVAIKNYPAVLFNFIKGKTAIEGDFTPQQYQQLGEVLSRIHQAYKTIGEYSAKEDFNIKNEPEFIKVVSIIDNHLPKDEIETEALVILKPIRLKLLNELIELSRLGKILKDKDLEFVLCHGEPSPGNIMVDQNNEVYLIDWDEPLMAPKEKDLLFFESNLGPFSTGYAKFSSDVIIDREAWNFYIHSWNVAEIIDWGQRIFINKLSAEEKQHALEKLKEFLIESGLGD